MLNTPTMNLDLIRTFVIVGQSKGIYEAAAKLNLNHTNVSRHIKALEKLYGTKLVKKISKNYIELTDDGKELFDGYEKAYNLLFVTEKSFIQNKNLNSGKISIGTSTDIELNLLNDKIIKFKEKYTNTSFKITNSPVKELYEKLIHYNIDFVIGDELALKRTDGVKSKSLYNEEYCLIYDEKKYNINNLSDINQLPLILPVSTKTERKLFENLLQENNIERNLSVEEVTNILNKQSGLLGIAGKNDFRDLENLANSGDEKAKLAIKMLRNSIIKFIAQYYIELNGNVDAIVFTAGIGENAMTLRSDVVNSISNAMNIKLDKDANDNIARFKEQQSGVISTPDSKIKVMVVPTNEEYMILKDTFDLSQQVKLKGHSKILRK